MRKKSINTIFRLACLLAAGALLAACATAPAPSTAAPASSSAVQVKGKPLQLIYPQQYAGVENGCYQIRHYPDNSSHILFIDYATQTKNYLSGKPGAGSAAAGDPSLLWPSKYGSANIFVLGEHLYVVKPGMLIFDQSRWEEGRAYIEQMKKDGADHRQFFLKKNELIAGSKLATDGENLFFMKWVYEMDKGATLQNPSALVLAKMDLKTGKVEDIERCAAKPSTHINGVLEDCLVVENRGNANPQSASTQEDRMIDTIQWILFNPATKVKKEMGSWDFPAKSLQLHEGKLYELDTNTGRLTETVLATGARRTLLEDKSKGQFPQIPAEAKAYLHPEIVDGHIQVNFITPGKKQVNIAYDLATGKAAEVTRPQLERIVSQSDTAYHVIIGYQAYNGDTHFAQTVERTALIEKDWYWTSRVGYLPIADQVPPEA